MNIEKTGTKATQIAIAGNVFLTILNILIGLYSGSFALISEGAHTLSDIATTIIAYIGFKIAQKPADKEHPIGHGRAEAIAGLLITIFLFIVAYEIITRAIRKLIFHETIIAPSPIAMIMALIGIIINLLMSTYIIKIGKKINSPALIADGKHQRVDVYSSITILIGLIIANLGYPIFDPLIGLIIGIIILKTAFEIVIENVNNIMGKIPSQDLINEIEETTLDVEGVLGVHDIQINYLGNYATVTLHIELPPEMSLNESHKIVHLVQEDIMKKINIIKGVTGHACPYGLEYDHKQEINK